jgi:hypothetical protein
MDYRSLAGDLAEKISGSRHFIEVKLPSWYNDAEESEEEDAETDSDEHSPEEERVRGDNA